MKSYKTISETAQAEFTEKKSEFIAKIAPVKTEKDALNFLNAVRSNHRKARHNCYAYILRNEKIERYNDDGEPSGTAGMPILEVLRSHGLFDLICVVTRYFGGILLGAGGLTRAYSKSASEAVKATVIVKMIPAQVVKIKSDYAKYGRIMAAIAEFGGCSESENFSDVTEISAIIPLEIIGEFEKNLVDICNGAVFVEMSRKCYWEFGKIAQR